MNNNSRTNQKLALEFFQSAPGLILTPEEFKAKALEETQVILDKRFELFTSEGHEVDLEKMPPIPIQVYILLEDGKSLRAMFFPKNDEEKTVFFLGVKQVIADTLKKANITQVIFIVEVWMTSINTKNLDIPFKEELTSEQLDRKINHKFKTDKVEKYTRIMVNVQEPKFLENNQVTTRKVVTEWYSLFEYRLLVLEEEITAENLEQADVKDKSNPLFNLFDYNQTGLEEKLNAKTFNFNLLTSIEYLQYVNKTYLS